MKRVCLFVVVLLSAPAAIVLATQNSDYGSGSHLLRACELSLAQKNGATVTHQQAYDAGYCDGLVGGVGDMTKVAPALNICVPESVVLSQVTQVVVWFLNDHPEQLPEHGSTVIVRALQNAFACP